MKNIKLSFILLLSILFPLISVAGPVLQSSAEQVAKNYYFEQTDILIDNSQFETIFEKKVNGESYYFVFNLTDNKGFIIISGDDDYYPVIAYSPEGKFVTEGQPENISSWMNQYIEQIKYLRNNPIEKLLEISELWQKYNVSSDNFFKSETKTKSVEPLAGHILWDQGSGWNQFCPPGTPVGCVATAMGIIMKYWEYPIHGTGSHSYYHGAYGTQSADFGESTYFWANMDNTEPNIFSALISYHLGVSVNMNYAPGGSGAFSHTVDDALEDYFRYSTDATYSSRSGNYTQEQWINLLKGQIDAGRPLYYSGRDDDDGGHAFVCSGYTDTDLFHFNFGWSGSNNGYYTVNDVGGFYISQAVVYNIYPENSNTYPESPASISCVLDNTDINIFKADLEWEAPVGKDVSTYLLYRNFDEIAELNNTELTYSDLTEPGNYHYSIAAKYTNGDESLTVSDYLQGLFTMAFFAIDPDNGNEITLASVTFNGEEKLTTFTGAVFSNVPYGGDYIYTVTHQDYPTTSGYTDVIENSTLNIVMDGSTVDISSVEESDIEIYPNPVTDNLRLNMADISNNPAFEIINISGQVILNGYVNSEKMNININNLSSGYYILKINNENEFFTRSFIKK